MSIETIKSNYSHSRINYIERFMLLWLPFNAWYNNQSKATGDEKERVLSVADNKDVFNHYKAVMTKLSDLTDPKIVFLMRAIDNLSHREWTDDQGHLQSSNIDTTSTKYKIIADRSNVHTTFLKSLCILPNTTKDEEYIHEQLQPIKTFSFNEADKDTYFSQIYRSYSEMMATAELMTENFNATEHIPRILHSFGLVQFGEIL